MTTNGLQDSASGRWNYKPTTFNGTFNVTGGFYVQPNQDSMSPPPPYPQHWSGFPLNLRQPSQQPYPPDAMDVLQGFPQQNHPSMQPSAGNSYAEPSVGWEIPSAQMQPNMGAPVPNNMGGTDAAGPDNQNPEQKSTRRTNAACESCKKLKIKCNVSSEDCTQCQKRGFKCEQKVNERLVARDYISKIERRNAQLEALNFELSAQHSRAMGTIWLYQRSVGNDPNNPVIQMHRQQKSAPVLVNYGPQFVTGLSNGNQVPAFNQPQAGDQIQVKNTKDGE